MVTQFKYYLFRYVGKLSKIKEVAIITGVFLFLVILMLVSIYGLNKFAESLYHKQMEVTYGK